MHEAKFAVDEVRKHVPIAYNKHQVAERSADRLQSAALKKAIEDYEKDMWEVIGQKLGKPGKVSNVASQRHSPAVQTLPTVCG